MRIVTPTSRYKRALKLCRKRGYDLRKIAVVIEKLQMSGTLPPQNKPHKLTGNHTGKWECHIEPDWLLIYTVDDKTLNLLDTGTHSDLF